MPVAAPSAADVDNPETWQPPDSDAPVQSWQPPANDAPVKVWTPPQSDAPVKKLSRAQAAVNAVASSDPSASPFSTIGKAVDYLSGIAKSIPADIAQTASGDEAYYQLQNLASAALGDKQLPIQQKIDAAASEAPGAATLANVSQGAAGAAPLLITGSLDLPAIASKAVALGFSGQMIAGVKDLATQYGAEMAKPADQRDPAKLAQLRAGLISTGIFAPLAGAHGATGISDIIKPSIENDTTTPEQPTPPIPNEIQIPNVRYRNAGEIPAAQTEIGGGASTVADQATTELDEEGVSKNPTTEQIAPKPPASAPADTGISQPVGETGVQPGAAAPSKLTAPDGVHPFDSGDRTQQFDYSPENLEKYNQLQSDLTALVPKAVDDPAALDDLMAKQSQLEDLKNRYNGHAPKNLEPSAADETPSEVDAIIKKAAAKANPQAILQPDGPKPNDLEPVVDINGKVYSGGDTHADVIVKNGLLDVPDIMTTDKYRKFRNKNTGQVIGRREAADALGLEYNLDSETLNSLKQQSPTTGLGAENTKNAPVAEAITPAQSPVTGSRDITGLAARVRTERENAGMTDVTQPGAGIAPEASVERGRELVQSGADPEAIMQQFEKTNRVSSDDFAIARAHTENLARATNQAEEKFGTNSPEFRAAYKTESDWASRTKAMQTEWAKSGHAQQGEVDIDTGTFSGIKRAYRDANDGEELPKKDEAKAKELAAQNQKLEAEKAALLKRLSESVDKTTQKVEPHILAIANRIITASEGFAKSARERIAARGGRLTAGLDPADLADHAIVGADYLLHGIRDLAEWSAKMTGEFGAYIKPHLKQIYDESVKLDNSKFTKSAGDNGKIKRAVKSISEKSSKDAEDAAIAAAHKTVREAASKLADAEKKQSVAQSGKNKEASQVQFEAARKAAESAAKTVREAAARAAELENKKRIAEATQKQVAGTLPATRTEFLRFKGGKMDADQVKALWDYTKKNYIDKGNSDFGDIVHKVATDLGLKFDDVANGLAQPKGTKALTDALWRKQTDARRVSESAKRWLRQVNSPILGQIVPRAARLMFGAKVFGHGGVAFGTHAPMVAFMPKYWNAYLKDFGKMYKMVFSPAEYEKNVQALRADPNFNTAARAGLVNDPYKVEDFNNPDMAQYFGRLSGAGNRGYFALKVLRQDMFNQGWNRLPETIKTPEMAKAMSDDINHITGVVKSGIGGNKASLALFAPRLLASRAAFLAGDPYKAVEIATTAMSPSKWKALPPEQKFQVINQVKQKATIVATAYGLLLANQAILNAIGSGQKVNLTDPTKSDFWKFKVAGMDFSFGNAMLNMARLPIRLWRIGAGDGGKMKHVIYPDESMYSAAGEFARSQASPMAGLGLDLVFKGDYQNRPLPQIPGYGKPIPVPKRLAAQGIQPYTWPEFFAEQASPIPLEEAEREVWRTGMGLSPAQQKQLVKAMGTTIVMMATGGRLTEDIQSKK